MKKIKHFYRLIGLKLSLVHLDFWRMTKNVKYLYNNTMLIEISHVLRSF